MSLQLSVAFVGFGEAATTFAGDKRWRAQSRAIDIDPARMRAMEECGVLACPQPADALGSADVVLSLVTADTALEAAQMYAAHLKPGALWCDMNSIAPETKRRASSAIEAAGGRYADVAIMSPVQPAALKVPLLVAGQHGEQACELLPEIGFSDCRKVGTNIGNAAAIKLCRSIIVKGMEALAAEMALAAACEGVFDEVLASLDASENDQGWLARTDYALDRMIVHGERRAAEMREASEMIAGLSIPPLMADAAAQWQQRIASLGFDPAKRLDSKLKQLGASSKIGAHK